MSAISEKKKIKIPKMQTQTTVDKFFGAIKFVLSPNKTASVSVTQEHGNFTGGAGFSLLDLYIAQLKAPQQLPF